MEQTRSQVRRGVGKFAQIAISPASFRLTGVRERETLHRHSGPALAGTWEEGVFESRLEGAQLRLTETK